MAKKKTPPLGELIVRLFHQDIEAAQLIAGKLILKSFSEIANMFGVTTNTVKTSWRKVGGMPGQRGAYPLADIIRWKLERETLPKRQDKAAADDSPLGRKRLADARLSEANATKREVEIQQLSGDLLYRADVEREIAEALVIFRRTMERIPGQLQPRFPKKVATELTETVRKETVGALTVLASHLEGMPDRILEDIS